jgi:hypothetical protein
MTLKLLIGGRFANRPRVRRRICCLKDRQGRGEEAHFSTNIPSLTGRNKGLSVRHSKWRAMLETTCSMIDYIKSNTNGVSAHLKQQAASACKIHKVI